MLGNSTRLACDDFGIANRIQERCFSVVDMTHDRDDRGARLQITFIIDDFFDHIFDVGIRHALDLVTELLNDQLGSVGVNGLVLCNHHAHLHQRFDNITHPFRHTVRQFGNHNRFGKVDGARDLFTLDRPTHRLLTGAFLLALHRRHGPLTPTFAARQRLVQRQLARTTAIIAFAARGALLAFTFVFAGRRRCLLPLACGRACGFRGRGGRCGLSCGCGFGGFARLFLRL